MVNPETELQELPLENSTTEVIFLLTEAAETERFRIVKRQFYEILFTCWIKFLGFTWLPIGLIGNVFVDCSGLEAGLYSSQTVSWFAGVGSQP
jgi:hypothetical protein